MGKYLDLLIAGNKAEKKLTAIAQKQADLDLLLEAEELFETKYAELQKREDAWVKDCPSYPPLRLQVYICNYFPGHTYAVWAKKSIRFRRLIKESKTGKKTGGVEHNPFNPDTYIIKDRNNYNRNSEEKNFHRAIWLDFMILVLEDEVLELMGDESLMEEVPGVPEDMPVLKGLS